MKKLLVLLTCAIVLSTSTPLAAFPGKTAQDNGSDHKHSWYKPHIPHKTKHPSDQHDTLNQLPKSVGWWHHCPGPAGFGAK